MISVLPFIFLTHR